MINLGRESREEKEGEQESELHPESQRMKGVNAKGSTMLGWGGFTSHYWFARQASEFVEGDGRISRVRARGFTRKGDQRGKG